MQSNEEMIPLHRQIVNLFGMDWQGHVKVGGKKLSTDFWHRKYFAKQVLNGLPALSTIIRSIRSSKPVDSPYRLCSRLNGL